MKRTLTAVVAVFGLCSVTALALARNQGPQTAKNLQVLPKNMPMPELKAAMKAQAKSLGVQCDFCHDTDDFASDAKKEKKTARWMMTMTMNLNKEFKAKDMITCGTCHNGHELPPMGGADLEKAKASQKK